MTSPCQSCIFLYRRNPMFKIFRNNCCGLDIHKTWIYACIGITDPNGRTEYKQARFSSFSKGLRELAAWLFPTWNLMMFSVMSLENLHVPLPTISWNIQAKPLMSLLLSTHAAKHLSLKSRLLLTGRSLPNRLSNSANASLTLMNLKPTGKRSSLKSFRLQNLFLPF